MKKKTNFRWVISTALISFAASVTFTFASSKVMSGAGYAMAFVVLAAFIAIGILFDIIGVAVTAASEKPFHSMASHKVRGALEAVALIKNAEKVASICNDVVGDISGIVSGATAAIIASNLVSDTSAWSVVCQLLISGAVAALTIGGKALGKATAINKSTKIVLLVGKVVSIRRKFISKR